MAKSKAMYGISRIDDPLYRTHAWRVSLRRQGKLIVKNFPDKKFSGKRKALQEAKNFRDEVVRKYPPTTRKQFCATVRRNNTSGIPGVYTYGKRYRLKNGAIRETRYWEAHWPVGENSSAKASFSYNTFGEEKAKELAIQARKEGIRRLQGVFWASQRGQIEASEIAAAEKKASAASAKAPASSAKKSAAKRSVGEKSAGKKAAVKKAAVKKKAVAKKMPKAAPKVAAKAAAKKATPKKAAPKKVAPKKPTQKRAVASKQPAKAPAPKKAASKKAAPKKATVKKAASKAKKVPAKRAATKAAKKS